MIPKFRAWMKSLKWMCEVTVIDYDLRSVDICRIGDVEHYTEMTVRKDEVILMQSTGLKDKNGVEIFEGDIVGMRKHTLANQHYYEVFKHRGGTFRLRNKFYGCELWLRHEYCEVLGNIYENPELMEADNDPER